MSKRRLLYVLTISILCQPPVLSAQADIYHVTETKGLCEIRDAGSADWRALSENALLKVGSRIRTGRDGAIEISGSPALENVFFAGPDSQITLLHEEPARISLDQGDLWILKESPAEMRVLTRECLAVMRDGGCRIRAAKGARVLVQVFGETVQIFDKTPAGYSDEPRTIEEGFQHSAGQLTRLDFTDYSEWQVWYKKNDKRKDGLIQKD